MLASTKAVISFFRMVVAFFTSFSQLLVPFGMKIANGGEKAFFEKWSPDQAYTADYAVTLEKDPSKDFVVLNFADIQLRDDGSYSEQGDVAYAMVKKLVKEIQPDLITLSGDNAWATYAYVRLVKEIDSYGIPWAPVMGNHEGQGTPSEFWCAMQYYNAENCVFKFGPADMGYGNYVINVTENGEIIHSIYMMDTHSGCNDTEASKINDNGISGIPGDHGYDFLWANQLEWYKWAVTGTNAIAGKNVESTVIAHIPVYQYRDAWAAATDDEGNFVGEYAETSFGTKREDICSPDADNGFFALMKELGSTKNMIVGHDHVNNFSIVYDGIRLSYALKTGSGCYADNDMMGGSTLTINSDGVASFEHHFVDPASMMEVIALENNGIC